MNWQTTNLDELLASIWKSLEEAAHIPDHPFRTASLATAWELEPGVRIVVLRKGDAAARTLMCYTDARSSKVRQLRRNPEVEWLFHDPAARMQIRASGTAMVHQGNATARKAWDELPPINRLNYASNLAPGNRIAGPDESVPPEWRGKLPSKDDLDFAFENFAVITASVDHFDWFLAAQNRNRRAGFFWKGYGFEGQWLVP